jgi:glycosyltransferase involved in cell wall biosynthesis
MPSHASPRVSIAIPAYNSAESIGETIDSALSQSVADVEVVIADDASSDATADVVRSFTDPRIRLYRNPVNLGHSGNWNYVVSLCRAPFVKFLCADDLLRGDCVERMLAIFERAPNVGLVFSRRQIVFPPADPEGREFRDVYDAMYRRFGPLDEVNDGRRLFAVYAAAGFDDNWIGEPTNVMMRRSLLERLPGFHPHIHQASDMELWIRAMFHSDVGFVDEALATYRIGTGDSLTDSNFREGKLWLDRLWLFDSLLRDAEIRKAHPELRRRRWHERARCAVRVARLVTRPHVAGQRMRELRFFARFRRGLAGA